MFLNDTPICNVLTAERTEVPHAQLKDENWWIYPNDAEGKFSKVKARVNFAGYLVTGQDLDTRIVCIQDGLLTLSDHGCVDAVMFNDHRIFLYIPPPISNRREVKEVKLLFASHHFVYHSKSASEIAKVVNVDPQKIVFWSLTDEWRKALKELWGYEGCPFFDDFYEHCPASFSDIEGQWIHLFETPRQEPVVDIPVLKVEVSA